MAGGLHAGAMDRAALLGLSRLCALWAALLALFPCGAQGNWMWLGIASFGVPEKLGCANLPLNSRQKELCKKKPYLLPSIREGARLGIQECRSQFKHERWNCLVTVTAQPGTSPLFGYELSSGESRDRGGWRRTKGDKSFNSCEERVLARSRLSLSPQRGPLVEGN